MNSPQAPFPLPASSAVRAGFPARCPASLANASTPSLVPPVPRSSRVTAALRGLPIATASRLSNRRCAKSRAAYPAARTCCIRKAIGSKLATALTAAVSSASPLPACVSAAPLAGRPWSCSAGRILTYKIIILGRFRGIPHPRPPRKNAPAAFLAARISGNPSKTAAFGS